MKTILFIFTLLASVAIGAQNDLKLVQEGALGVPAQRLVPAAGPITSTATFLSQLGIAPLISPTFITPILGVATATSLNGNFFTTGTYTLTGSAGKTLTFTNSLTLTGTDGTTMTFPTTTATIARKDAAQTFTGVQSFTSPDITTSLTSPSATFALLNVTPQTINFAGGVTTLNIGNASTTTNLLGSLLLNPAGAAAGAVWSIQGTAPTPPANSISYYAPASVPTAYGISFPSAPTTGYVKRTGTSSPQAESIVSAIPSTDTNAIVYNAAQSLSAGQQAQAQANIGSTSVFGFSGQLYRTAGALASVSIDVTKAALNRTLTASEQESFSATPATDLQMAVYYTANSGGPWTLTWNTPVYSYGRQADVSSTGVIIPASGTYAVVYNYSLSRARWEITGDPVLTVGTGSFVLSGGALNVTTGKTLAATNTITFSGTDSTVFTLPATTDTLAGLGTAQTFSATQNFSATTPLDINNTGANGIRIFNTSDKVTNVEELNIGFSSNIALINSFKAGTGTGRVLRLTQSTGGGAASSMDFQRATTSTSMMRLYTSGNITNTVGTFLGQIDGTFTNTSGQSGGLFIQPTYNEASGTSPNTVLKLSAVETALGSGEQDLIDGYAGAAGTTKMWTVNNKGSNTEYAGVATAGWGHPAIYGANGAAAQSAANPSIATYTVGAADGTFWVSANMNVTAATALSTSLTCTYTDESNTARAMIFPVQQLGGSFISGGLITGTGPWETSVIHIRCKASTAITIFTAAGTFTGVTYTAEGVIAQVR